MANHPSQGRDYFTQSRRPLQVLAFLLPLIVAYELAMLYVLRIGEDGTRTNLAHKTLVQLFDVLGVAAAGWYVPGLAVVAVLLLWHVISREAWWIDVRALGVMAAESAALALPLLVAGGVIERLVAGPLPAIAALNGVAFSELSLLERIAISVGAGLYEELVFRMFLLGLVLHTLFISAMKWKPLAGNAAAIALSAIAFAAYHFDLWSADATFSWPHAIFYFVAGSYFGVIFIVRGFGIVVAAHAIYDIIVALLA